MDEIKMSFWDEKEAKRLFQKLAFYNTFIEKPPIKHLKNIDLRHELLLSWVKYEANIKSI